MKHKGQWRGALMFSLICAWTNIWANNWDAGDLRRHRALYDVIVMWTIYPETLGWDKYWYWLSNNSLKYTAAWELSEVRIYRIIHMRIFICITGLISVKVSWTIQPAKSHHIYPVCTMGFTGPLMQCPRKLTNVRNSSMPACPITMKLVLISPAGLRLEMMKNTQLYMSYIR